MTTEPPTFTPGPWQVVGPTGHIYTTGDPYGRGPMMVAQVRGWGHLTGKGGGCAFDEDKAIAIQDANARLIAQSPRMYDFITKRAAEGDPDAASIIASI